ncbi:magnesium/cobalt transporter CorA [Paenibacillus sp.]|uniref:magnesium/cobalt transporter CorA n=1 Tax=Paenibacillus sp. TaxID=58172 RepID=UPI002D727090|nr:magnesium/cobalt transporter CorA [Paenibacillus sp.]HZG83749.1 magnesium/cobalt transporter CorA [Paenibacillus sp.]
MKVRLVQKGVFTLVENVAEALIQPVNGFYWIDASPEELETLQPLFHLHELAVEDCLQEEEQRPKLEIHEGHYFIVVNSIRFDDEEFFFRAVNIFLGKHFIITVTRQKVNELRAVKPVLWEEEVDSPDRFLYHLADLIVDNYFNVADRIEDKIEKLEEDILRHTRKTHLNEIIGLRSEILYLKKVLMPQKEVIGMLARKELRLIDGTLQKYFADMHENAVKVTESFDTFRDLMGNLREAYQSSIASRANEIMRVFTAVTTIFIPLTFITGVYGMNLMNLPGEQYPHFAIVLIIVMALLAVGMFALFRKKEWL